MSHDAKSSFASCAGRINEQQNEELMSSKYEELMSNKYEELMSSKYEEYGELEQHI